MIQDSINFFQKFLKYVLPFILFQKQTWYSDQQNKQTECICYKSITNS